MLPQAHSQTSQNANPFSVYQQTYGAEVDLSPYSFNLQTFLAYPYLFRGTTRSCQLQLNEYNQYLLRNRQDYDADTPPSAETLNVLDQISSYSYLSSHNENDFTGYERCRDEFSQRYYVVHRKDQPHILHFGMCIPSQCTPDDVLYIIRGIRRVRAAFGDQNVNIEGASLGALELLDDSFELRVYDSDVMNEDAKDVEFGHVVFWSFFGIMALLVISATAYSIFMQAREEADINDNLRAQGARNFSERLILGFSLGRSLEKLTNTSSRLGANTLEPLRGFKFMFAAWLSIGIYAYVAYLPLKESEKLENELSKDLLTVFGKAVIFMTDGLLWISGVYTAYGYIYEQVEVRNVISESWKERPLSEKLSIFGLDILNKVGKLWFLSLMSILIFGWAGPTIGNGPVFSEQYYYNTRKMNDYWYTYLTFTNNFLEIQNQGLIWGSFIATEVQLFICALPFIRMLINRRTMGMAILSFLMICSLSASFVWSITKDVKISVIRDAYQVMEYQQKFFLKAFPYCMGIFTGLFTWKAHHEENEGTMFQQIVEKIEENKAFRYMMHFCGVSMILLVIFALHPIDHDRDHDIDAVSAVLLTASQILMPLGLALNFIPMVLNRSEILKSIMGSRLLKPHSSLLFIMIPASGTLTFSIFYTQQDGEYFSFRIYIIHVCAHWLLLSLGSFILWCLVISPLYNMFDSFIDYFKNSFGLGGGNEDIDDQPDKLYKLSEENSDDGSHRDYDEDDPPGPYERNSFSQNVDE
ncbi:unnamed protein product [Moneuplotes crassus]|uniref:Nose resistant-to-fluoxetine protein N-terminal domain-containing protein n=1 Tax=Euplotes crassus TaxID=5936 RepID=A0AAD2DCE1_EUPCR|nr:unnamed protein product [Moneuplotes crassus]